MTAWQCMVATGGTRCQATVTQWKMEFLQLTVTDLTSTTHAAAGALIIARIKSRIRKEVAAGLVKPVSLIVRQVLQEKLTKTPCIRLPRRRNLVWMAKSLRKKLRSAYMPQRS